MKQPLTLPLGATALLCVDLQEEHRRDPRYLVEGYGAVIARIRCLQDAARAAGMSVIHAAYVVDRAARAAKPFHPTMPDGSSAFSDAADPLTAVCPEVAPVAGEALLIKTEASCFASGVLAPLLRRRGVEWIVVAGVWTEACIAATVNDAIGHGLRVMLVKDACATRSVAMHQTAILNLANRLYGGAVVDTDRACRLIAGEPAEAWRVQGAAPLRFTYENATELYEAL